MNSNVNNGSGRRPALTAYQANAEGRIAKDADGYQAQVMALWPSKYEGYIGSMTINGHDFDVIATPGLLVREKGQEGRLVAAIRFGERKDGQRYPVVALARATKRLVGFLNEEEAAEPSAQSETAVPAAPEQEYEEGADIPF